MPQALTTICYNLVYIEIIVQLSFAFIAMVTVSSKFMVYRIRIFFNGKFFKIYLLAIFSFILKEPLLMAYSAVPLPTAIHGLLAECFKIQRFL
jgi:hypothetical protein